MGSTDNLMTGRTLLQDFAARIAINPDERSTGATFETSMDCSISCRTERSS